MTKTDLNTILCNKIKDLEFIHKNKSFKYMYILSKNGNRTDNKQKIIP